MRAMPRFAARFLEERRNGGTKNVATGAASINRVGRIVRLY